MKRRQKVPWIRADFRKLREVFAEDTFDCVVDKAAMDALVTDEGDPWNPNHETVDAVKEMCREIRAVLKPGGRLIQISFQQPHFRRRLMTDLTLSEVHDIPIGLGYFLYIWTKS